MPTQKILNKIVTKKDGVSYVYKIGNVDGYLNPTDGLFYEESTYETPIQGADEMIYVDLPTNYLYRYDETELAFVQIGGGAGGTISGYLNPADGKFYEESTFVTEIEPSAELIYIDLATDYIYRYDETNTTYVQIGGGKAITYVDTLPSAPDIEDKIYGVKGESVSVTETINTTCGNSNFFNIGFISQGGGVLVPDENITFTYEDTEIKEIDYETIGMTVAYTIKDTEDTQIGSILSFGDNITLDKTTLDWKYNFHIGNELKQELSEIVLDSSLEFLTAADIDELMSSVAGQQWDYLAEVIVDTATSTKKVWSSSKITTELSTTLDASKTYTDEQIARFRSTSYVLVSSTAEMTDPSVLYLLPIVGEDDTYEIYALIKDTSDVYIPTAIGTTQTKLEDYYTKLEADALFVKGTDVITKTKYGNEVGEVDDLTTTAKEVVGAINELKTVTETFETENIIWP